MCMFMLKEEGTEGQNSVDTICIHGICSFPVVRDYRGSFTVEAACVLPLVLACLIAAICIGIELQTEVKQQTLFYKEQEPLDLIGSMYRKEYIEEIIGKLYEN